MQRFSLFSLFLSLLFALSPAFAQTLQTDVVSLKPNEEKVWTFKAPPSQEGQTTVLSLEARIDAPPRGSMYFMQLTLNGVPLDAAINRLQTRLRNKPLVVNPNRPELLWDAPGSGWRVLYAPDWSDAHKAIYGDEAYRFQIEIGDLLQPGDNTLSIRRNAAINTAPLLVRNVRLESQPLQSRQGAPLPHSNGELKIEMSEDGGIVLQTGPVRIPISSSFSLPGGGWRRFGAATGAQTAEEAAKVNIVPGQPRIAVYESAEYRVRRSVHVERGKASIRDEISNKSDQDLGMMIRHEMKLPVPVPTVRLGGDDNPSLNAASAPNNPTLFIPFANFSLGLVAEDDVLRAQGVRSYEAATQTAGLRTERLVVPARQTVTLEWSLYALPTTDYYDFINRVRTDWGVNDVTINGPWWWGFHPEQILAMSDEALHDYVRRTSAFAVVSSGGWVDRQLKGSPPRPIGFGTGVMEPAFADLRARFREAADKVHRVVPGVKFVVYNHMFFNEPEANPEQFKDSWITDATGKRFVNNWGGVYTPSAGVFPTLTNSFGPAFRAALEQQKREMHVDGFYIDETLRPSGLHDPVTYNAWDGRSGLLNPTTFRIEHKIGYLQLLAQDYQHKLFDEMRAGGAWFLGNDSPATKSFNRDSWPRFVETQDVITNSYKSHLYTPLAYGSSAPSVEILRRNLHYGVLHSCSGPGDKLGIVGKFFPITVTELHEDWVKGRERIVTARSGAFGWPGEKFRYRLWSYRADGAPVSATPAWQPGNGTVNIQLPENGIAILEREMPPLKPSSRLDINPKITQ